MKDLITYTFVFLVTFISVFIFLVLTHGGTVTIISPLSSPAINIPKKWQVTSIDTMKYSRDMARDKLNDPSFDMVIDKQVSLIAQTGATHIAIDTPYDQEFHPILLRWVAAARKYHLHVWFRSNFSGWEQWFDYPKMTEVQHLAATKQFIISNKNLFEDHDIFEACQECENGAKLPIADQGKIAAYRMFLIQQHQVSRDAFIQIDKNVVTSFNSMNLDVAKAVMDPQTTQALGGIVVIDHYVATPVKLANDVRNIAARSQGSVVLGEFGAPIPNITGQMTAEEQRSWIEQALGEVQQVPQLLGVNYWTSVAGSTAIWLPSGEPQPAVSVITAYYKSHK